MLRARLEGGFFLPGIGLIVSAERMVLRLH